MAEAFTPSILSEFTVNEVATASVLEIFIDGAEKRNWFLFEASRKADGSGH